MPGTGVEEACTGQVVTEQSVIELGNSVHHTAITEASHFIFSLYVLLGTVVAAAEAVVFFLVLVVEHIKVEVAHEAGGTAVIQFAFSTLSHDLNDSFPVRFLRIPRVNIGENA